MKRTVVLAVASLVLLVTLVVTMAATPPQETPNDPRVNPDANACYAGGSWAGKCKLDDELWIAGWYEIRLERRLISGDQVPDQYKWILPQTTEEPLPTPTGKPR